MANTSIKFTNLSDTFLSKGLLFDGNLAISSPQIYGEGFSEFDNQFAMPFLYNQIGQNLPTNVKQSMPSHDPLVTVSLKEFVSGFFKCCRTSASKCFLKPLEKANVCVRNFKNAPVMAVFVAIIWLVFKFAGMKTALPIDNSGKIGQFQGMVSFLNIKISVFVILIGKFFHKFPFIGSLSSIHVNRI